MAAERIIMSYATLRGPSDRPLTQHMNESPNVSPCRDCEFQSADKNEHPACINCLKLHYFRTIPVNLHIDRKIEDEHLLKYHGSIYAGKRKKKRTSILQGTICSICHESEAVCHGYKDLHTEPICNRCFNRLAARFKRHGRITLPSGEL
jgi:hypothetical protein